MLMVFFPTCFEPMKGVSDACPMTSMKKLPMIPRLSRKYSDEQSLGLKTCHPQSLTNFLF